MGFNRVYLLQNTEEMNEELADKFRACGYEVVGMSTEGERAVADIEKSVPDLLITELVLPKSDGLQVVKKVKNRFPDVKVVVLTALNSEEAIASATKYGASYFMVKPYSFEILSERVKEIFSKSALKKENRNEPSLDEKISKIFINVGIPPHIKGYCFLREGVKMAVNDPPIINNITKKLYPMIGEKYNTTPSKVERAIRHAIEVAWNRGRIESINALLGVRAYVGQEKPTNGEFIALIADKMLLEMV